MRQTYYLTTFLMSVAILLNACQKDSAYWGEASALKNGILFEGRIKAYNNHLSSSKVDISIETFDSRGNTLETLLFFKVSLQEGKNFLSLTQNQLPEDSLTGCSYFNGFEDQIFDIFQIASNDSTSYLEITEYNEGKGELRGKFNLMLWPLIPGSWNAPDSLVFSDGVFHTRLNN